MPKPLNELPDDNEIVQSDYSRAKLQVDNFLRHLSQMEEDPEYLWAYDTISGIRTSVQLNGWFTTGQYEAIKNIQRAKETRGDKPKGRRRYEGWDESR